MIPRYQTDAMAAIWDEESTFARWTQVEVAACEAFHARGEISDEDIDAIHTLAHHQSAERVREIEQETDHDVVAFCRAVCERIGQPAARHFHRGLTSSDVVDTALAMAMVESLDQILGRIEEALTVVAKRAREFKHTLCMGRTHGIHAEPTTFGIRLAGWYTELTRARTRLEQAKEGIAFGKVSGAVGTFSQTDPAFEAFVMERLGLQCEPVATQVIPRDRHAEVFCALALLGGGIERAAIEIRSLQRTEVREVEEAFKHGQTGSSAMPHKRNPITSERLTGMSRLLRGYAVSALENMALWHDRDISHSSVERIALPDAFHLADYMLMRFTRLVDGLRVYEETMLRNITITRGLVFSQSVLGVLLSQGLDRTIAYKAVQKSAMQVWEGTQPDFRTALLADDDIAVQIKDEQLDVAFDLSRYTEHIDAIFARAGL